MRASEACNREAKRLLILRLRYAPIHTRDVIRRRYNSTQKRFKLIQEALDKAGITTQIISRREHIKPRHIYHYDVQVNFEVVKHYKGRNGAKVYIYRLYRKHCLDYEQKQAAIKRAAAQVDRAAH